MKAPTVLLGTLCSDSIKRNGVQSTPYLGKKDTCLSLLPLLTLYRTDISVTRTLSAGPRCPFKRELIVMSTTGYPQWNCSSTAPALTGRQFGPCSNTRGDAARCGFSMLHVSSGLAPMRVISLGTPVLPSPQEF